MKTQTLALLSGVSFFAFVDIGLAATYDAAIDFAAPTGSGKTWSFGWSESLDSSVNSYQIARHFIDDGGGHLTAFGVEFDSPDANNLLPVVAYNPTTTTIFYNGTSQIAYFPHELTLHPGFAKRQSVMQ